MLSDRPLLRLMLLAVLIAAAAGALFIPDWFEDPTQKILGTWKDAAPRSALFIEADRAQLQWRSGTRHGKMPYTWLQTEHEPYTLQFTYHHEDYVVDVIFNGNDEAVALPRIWDKLPEEARRWVKEKNRAAGRPEKELRFLFRRDKD